MPAIENSAAKSWKHPFITMMAPAKEGKTTISASLSKHWPGELPAKQLTHLGDLVYLGFDRGALDGFLGLNLTTNLVDFSIVQNHAERDLLLKNTITELQVMHKDGALSGIIADTLSALDAALANYYATLHEFKPQLYQAVGVWMGKFFTQLSTIGCPIVFLTHVKAINVDFMKDEDKLAAQKRMALTSIETGEVGGPKATPEVCSNTLKLIRTQSSGTVGLQKEMQKNKPTEWWFYTRNWQGYELGNRAPAWADKEPANLRLLIEKARGGVK
jgi:hypothetical protein